MSKEACIKEKEHERAVEKAKTDFLRSEDVKKMSSVFRALADPTRLRIVLALLSGEMCVYHLTEVCGGTVSAISHQLRILREGGIVKATRLGQNIEYSVIDEHVRDIIEISMRHLPCTGVKE